MELFHEWIRGLHVAAGFVGLAAFWIPIFSRKGGSNHRLFGRIFKWCAYIVLAGAAVGLALNYLNLARRGIGPSDIPGDFAFLVFLSYLTFVTFVIVRHGTEVLLHKRELVTMNRPLDRLLGWGGIAASVFLVAYALYYAPPNRILLFALSPIGFAAGSGILRVLKGKRPERNAWLLEHLGAMLGAGIAFHTAFAVFGATRLFDLGFEGWVAVIPWILPTLLGVPATILWTRKYRTQLPAAVRERAA